MKKKILALLISVSLAVGTAGCGLDGLYGKVIETIREGEEALAEPIPEKEVTEEQLFYYYGYSCLDEHEQKVYRQLMAGIEEFQERIPVSTDSQEELNQIIMLLLTDHPEYFWTEGEARYEYTEWDDGSISDMTVIPKYTVTKEESEVLKRQIEEKANEWLEQVPGDADDYGKIKYVYETLINQVDYKDGCEQNQNIRSVFLEGSTVCMGYAKATQYLLNKMGIFCTLVIGEAEDETADTGKSSHAWNLVKIGEAYYYVDTTWGNPGYNNELEDALYISYSYLCCNWDALSSTHTLEGSYAPVPECVDDSYNYYKNKGCWYETYDKEQIKGILEQQLSQGSKMTELKFAGKEAYDAAVADIAEGELVSEMVTDSSILTPGQYYSWETYSGSCDNLIVILWK